jgi:GNAT superfamily N-acetyltransferase
MSEITFREYRPADAEDLLSIRNAIFPPLSLEQWRACEPSNTAAMAYKGDEVVGAIPMELRDFQVAPGAVINTIFEHAVGTREDMRSQGIGSGMIGAAREFLAERVEAMMVYRGAERSIGYRFYEKSGHVDLIYLRTATWEPEQAPETDCAIGGLAELYADAEEVCGVFAGMFGQYGGFPYRDGPGYWERAMGRGIYMVIPQQTHYIRYPSSGPLEAYMIVGEKMGERADQPLQVQDAAGSSAGVRECLKALANLAVDRAKTVAWTLSSEHPCLGVALEAGFKPDLRQMMIMGQVIAPQRLFDKVCVDAELVADLKINVWTPTRDYVLYEGPQAKTEVTIEAKDWSIHRLLCRRLDLAGAVAGDIVTIHNGTPEIVDRLSRALPYNVWAYPVIDYT